MKSVKQTHTSKVLVLFAMTIMLCSMITMTSFARVKKNLLKSLTLNDKPLLNIELADNASKNVEAKITTFGGLTMYSNLQVLVDPSNKGIVHTKILSEPDPAIWQAASGVSVIQITGKKAGTSKICVETKAKMYNRVSLKAYINVRVVDHMTVKEGKKLENSQYKVEKYIERKDVVPAFGGYVDYYFTLDTNGFAGKEKFKVQINSIKSVKEFEVIKNQKYVMVVRVGYDTNPAWMGYTYVPIEFTLPGGTKKTMTKGVRGTSISSIEIMSLNKAKY